MNLCKTIMSYEEVKNIFYKSDFFDWNKDDGLNIFKDEEGILLEYAKENFFHELNFTHEGNNVKLNPATFLHGKCDEFAVALAKEMGYKIGIVYEIDEATGSFSHLIHAYCVKDDGINIHNVDVRGICPDCTHIVCDDEFEYSYDYSVYDIMDVEEAVIFFEENMSDSRKNGHYNTLNPEAMIIINMFKHKFLV